MYAQWIKRELERSGKTQAELAPAMGLDAVKLSKSLNGMRRLQPAELEGASRFFEVPVPSNALSKPLVDSFDPDIPDMEGIGLDIPGAVDDRNFPADAIRELMNPGGLGPGGTIDTVRFREGVEVVQRDEVKDDYWRFPATFVRNVIGAETVNLIAIECQGDSMTPTLAPGERVWANIAHKRPTPDGLYAIRDSLDAIIIKRLELVPGVPPRVRIISDNPRHTTREAGLDEIEIIGKIVAGLKLF